MQRGGKPNGQKPTAINREVQARNLHLCQNNMNATATARALNMNNSTVEFHLTAAKEKTGINPRSFFGLIALLETIEETT